MITPLSIISLDQGKIWRAPADEDPHAAIAQPVDQEPVVARRPNRGWLWLLLIRPRAA
jgi:hypothetical protein